MVDEEKTVQWQHENRHRHRKEAGIVSCMNSVAIMVYLIISVHYDQKKNCMLKSTQLLAFKHKCQILCLKRISNSNFPGLYKLGFFFPSYSHSALPNSKVDSMPKII